LSVLENLLSATSIVERARESSAQESSAPLIEDNLI